MLTPEVAVDLVIESLHIVMLLVVLLVVPGLVTGLLVALVQAATQINEQTLSFLPETPGLSGLSCGWGIMGAGTKILLMEN